jgi:hypothetical protein
VGIPHHTPHCTKASAHQLAFPADSTAPPPTRAARREAYGCFQGCLPLFPEQHPQHSRARVVLPLMLLHALS